MTVCGLLRLDGADARRSTLTAMLAASSLGLPAARGVHVDGPFAVVTAVGSNADPLPPIAVDRSGLVVVLEARQVTARNAGVPAAVHQPRPERWTAGPGRSRTTDDQARLRLSVGSGRLAAGGWPADDRAPARDGLPVSGRPPGTDAPPGGYGRPVGLAGADGTDACLLAAAYRAGGEGSLAELGTDQAAVVWEPRRRRLVVARIGAFAGDMVTWSDGRVFAFGTEPAQVMAVGRVPLGRLDPGGRVEAQRPRFARVRQLAVGDRVTATAAYVPRRATRTGLRGAARADAGSRTAGRVDAGRPLG